MNIVFLSSKLENGTAVALKQAGGRLYKARDLKIQDRISAYLKFERRRREFTSATREAQTSVNGFSEDSEQSLSCKALEWLDLGYCYEARP